MKNYETIQSRTSNVKVKVTKANPTVTLTSKISDEIGSRKVVLSASIDKVGYGDNVTGTVKFINCTSDIDSDVNKKSEVMTENTTDNVSDNEDNMNGGSNLIFKELLSL